MFKRFVRAVPVVLASALAFFAFGVFAAGAAAAGANVAPNGDFEQEVGSSYFTNGPCAFSRTTDAAHSPTHALKIVSTTSSMCRWLSDTRAMAATAGGVYDVSVWLKTLGAGAGGVLSVNFWTSGGVYIPATVDAPQKLVGTQDWTNASVRLTAPAGAAFLRVEFRLTGPGTLWADDVSVTTADAPLPPPTVTIVSAVPSTIDGIGSSQLTWHASDNGQYSVRVNGIDCTTGNEIDAGSYTTAAANRVTTVLAASLPLGLTWVRVCLTNASGNGEARILIEKTLPSSASLLSGITAVAADYDSTCVLTRSGGVKCWGVNTFGQLGDGTTTSRATPVDVAGLTSGVTAIAAGGFHTCAITSTGGVKCWGTNWSGQLGDGTTTDRSTPVDVVGLAGGVKAVSVGNGYTCAVTSAGGAKCWGGIGDGTTTSRPTPVDVVGLTSGVIAITAGVDHTCALTTGGGVKCWGHNLVGGLGDGTTTDRLTPVDVIGLASGVTAIASAEWYTCALTNAGAVKCWGWNAEGQLGDGTTTTRLTPVDVVGLTGVTAITAGNYYICALTVSGGVKCWGTTEFDLIGGFSTYGLTPVDVADLTSGVTAISARFNHACALTSSGGVKCWGPNPNGLILGGRGITTHLPVDVLAGNLAPDATLEADPSTTYYSNGAGTFSWATDAAYTGTHALKITTGQPAGTIGRWMTNTTAIPVTPGTAYDVSAWLKTQAGNASNGQLVVTYWTATQAYVNGSATASAQQLTGTRDWTQAALQTTAPVGASYMRVELRLTGPGILWADEISVTAR